MLAQLHFIPQLEMQACNMIYQLQLYFIVFWCYYT